MARFEPGTDHVHDFKQQLFANNRRKRVLNLLYLDLIALGRVFTDVLPGPLRNLIMGRVFTHSGRDVFFDRRVYVKFPWLVTIGPRTSINRGVEFYGDLAGSHGVTIGADCYIAPHVKFFASGHDLDDLTMHVGADIVIGREVWIGAQTIVLPGVTVGDECVIAAGSVVTGDLPPGVLAGGVPARVIRDNARAAD